MRPPPRFARAVLVALLASLAVGGCRAQPRGAPAALVLERRIALPGVAGRIDHLAVDAAGGRLFVAVRGAGAVEALDLVSGRRLARIDGLSEPQGVGYAPAQDELFVANGGDGMVRIYRAFDLKPVGAIKLGDDADDVRVGDDGRVLVGFGHGLAVIDAASRRVLRTIPLPAHPEGFEAAGDRVIVNLPDAGGVGVFDLATGQALARWRNPGAQFNFPLALDAREGRVAAVYRLPARLVLFDVLSGRPLQTLGACGDSDDVFFDARRRRIHVVCGEGAVVSFSGSDAGYAPAGRVRTAPGARTGLFSPALDRLYVAARADGGSPAAIWVFRPNP
jgi:hypothetical protein